MVMHMSENIRNDIHLSKYYDRLEDFKNGLKVKIWLNKKIN